LIWFDLIELRRLSEPDISKNTSHIAYKTNYNNYLGDGKVFIQSIMPKGLGNSVSRAKKNFCGTNADA